MLQEQLQVRQVDVGNASTSAANISSLKRKASEIAEVTSYPAIVKTIFQAKKTLCCEENVSTDNKQMSG